MATKKVAKKAAKKAPAKKAAKKAVKKAPAKKVAKKAAVKKVAKKAPAKKAAVKKAAKKAPAKRVSTAPAVAVSSAPTTSAPVAQKAPAAAPAKKQGGQNRVMLAVIIGVLALGAIVISNGSDSDDAAPMPTESASASATPTESESSATVSTTAAPLGIVAKYTADGATIFWDATTAAEGLKGYSIEVSSNGGEFTELVMLGVDATQHNITKSDTEGWMSFKVSAVYNDGQKAEGKVFGLPGQYTN